MRLCSDFHAGPSKEYIIFFLLHKSMGGIIKFSITRSMRNNNNIQYNTNICLYTVSNIQGWFRLVEP